MSRLSSWPLAGLVALALGSGCAFSNQMERGDAAMARQDWDAAVYHYRKATKLDPDDGDARRRLAEAQSHAVGERLEDARRALAAGDLVGAARLAHEAGGIGGDNGAVTEISARVLDSVVMTGRGHVEEHRYAEARALYRDAGPYLDDAEARIVRADALAVERWVAALTTGRDQATKNKRPADALLHEQMILELAPSATERARCNQMAAALRGEHELVFGQRFLKETAPDRNDRPGRDERRDKPDRPGAAEDRYARLGRALAGASPTQWLRVAGPDEKIKTDVTLGFTQSRTRISDRRDVEVRKQDYQAGVRRVRNPDYARAADDVRERERRANDLQRDHAEQQKRVEAAAAAVAAESKPAGAPETESEKRLADEQRRLQRIRDEIVRNDAELRERRDLLARIPEVLEEPIIAQHTWEVMHHTVRASARLLTVVERGRRGQAITPIEHPLRTELSDTSFPPQPPIALAGDPLDLPDDGTLRAMIDDEALRTLQNLVQEVYAAAVADQLQKAMALDRDARVEQLVIYLAMDNAVVNAEVDRLLFETRGIPDASLLLDDCGTAD